MSIERIKVLIVDDHAIFRRGITDILDEEETIEIVGEATDGDEAVEKAKALQPHLVLMNLHMPRCNGVEATVRLQSEAPETKILMLTISDNEEDLVNAIKAGASGYILKNEEPAMLVQVIRYVTHGGIIVSPVMATKLMDELKRAQPGAAAGKEHPLNLAEQEILRFVAQGADDKAIANKLFTTENLVKTHLSNIMHKLLLANRRQAVDYARRHGLISSSNEKEPVKATWDEGAKDTLYTTEEVETEALSSPTSAVAEDVEGIVELVIPSLQEPKVVLMLHRWLKDVADADIGEITGSWGDDTVLKVTIRQPIPLYRMLAGLPVVAEVTEESYTENAETQAGAPKKIGPWHGLPKRFRIILKTG